MARVFTIRLTLGTSVGPYSIYYDTIETEPTQVNVNNKATINGTSNLAENLTLTEIRDGVDISIPDNSTWIILKNDNEEFGLVCDTNISPTNIATATPTPTPTFTPTPEPTITPTFTPTPEATITPTFTPTPEATITPTFTPTPEATITPTFTPTPEPEATPTPTPEATITPTFTPTPPALNCTCRTIVVSETLLQDGSNNDLYYVYADCDGNLTQINLATAITPDVGDGNVYVGVCASGASNMFKYGPTGDSFVGTEGMDVITSDTACTSNNDCFPQLPGTPTPTPTFTPTPAITLDVYFRQIVGNSANTTLNYTVNGGSQQIAGTGTLNEFCGPNPWVTIGPFQVGDVIVFTPGDSEHWLAGAVGEATCPSSAYQVSQSYQYTIVNGANDVSLSLDTTQLILTQVWSDSQPGSGNLTFCDCPTETGVYNFSILGNKDINTDLTNSTIYDNNQGNGTFLGDDKWYCLTTTEGSTMTISVQINNSGQITDWVDCSTITPTPTGTPTGTPADCYEWEVMLPSQASSSQVTINYTCCDNSQASITLLNDGNGRFICVREGTTFTVPQGVSANKTNTPCQGCGDGDQATPTPTPTPEATPTPTISTYTYYISAARTDLSDFCNAPGYTATSLVRSTSPTISNLLGTQLFDQNDDPIVGSTQLTFNFVSTSLGENSLEPTTPYYITINQFGYVDNVGTINCDGGGGDPSEL